MVAHEYAHAEAAYRQGDDTAYMLGRLTLNPLKHIDPLMTVIVPFLLWRIGAPPFGAAKPVPVNPRKYRQLQAFGFIPIMVLMWAFPGVLQALLWPAYELMGVGWALVRGFAVSQGAFPS